LGIIPRSGGFIARSLLRAIKPVVCDLQMFIEEKSSSNSQELKTKREALGLSLADIFQRTRISVSNLQAMEDNDFHLLPTAAYTKNFIKTYARTLGIDSEPILIKYEDYLNSLKGIQKLSPEEVSGIKILFGKISSIRLYSGIAVLIVISVVTWLISKQYQSSSDIINSKGSIAAAVTEHKEQTANSPVNETAPINQQVKDSPKLALNEINKQSPVKEQLISGKIENNAVKSSKEQVSLPDKQPAVNSEEASLLIINAIEETWIRIKADKNPSFQILLKSGEKFERKAASLEMDIGNAGGIKIQFKGKNIDNLGKSGQVTHLRLP
jgi:cytoskeletal protein RodZ